MGSLSTCIDLARFKALDTDKILFTDANLISIVNGILEQIYQTLVNVQSNLVYDAGTITTTNGVAEYTPSFTTRGGFLREGSWIDGEDTYLYQVSEADKIKWDFDSSTNQPEVFYVNAAGDIGYLWVPDNTYTIHHLYWKPYTAMATYADDDLPWENIWNQYIERMLIIEMKETQEADTSRQSVLAQIEWDKAMNLVYARGIRQEKVVSNMFAIEGI